MARIGPRTTVISLNVGRVKRMRSDLFDIDTAMDKKPIVGPMRVRRNGITGDSHADTTQVLYALGLKQIMSYMREMGHDKYPPGWLGENVLVEDLDEWTTYEGDKWRIGAVLGEAWYSREPCYKLDCRFNRRGAATKLKLLRRGGVMFDVIEPGEINYGDVMERVEIGDTSAPIIRPPRRV